MGGRYTRRRVLEATGVAGLGGVLGMASTAVAQQGWTSVGSPTGNTIYAVEHTAHGLIACGVGGEIHRRRKGKWKTEVEKGPSGNSKTLSAADTTDDGERFWAVGSSGVVGEYRPGWKTLYDHSNPLGISTEFTSVSVTGSAGDEQVALGKASGEVVIGERTGDGDFDWMVSETGSGYTVNAVDFSLSAQDGFVATNNGGVYRTQDGGQSWTDLGVDAAQTGFTAMLVQSGDPVQVFVGGGGGRIWRLDCDCNRWTPFEADTKRVYALEATDEGGRYLGAGASGRSYEYGESGWYAAETTTGNSLHGAAPADSADGIDVLVGASGTVLER